MNAPADRKYSETHEWYLVDEGCVTIGITQYAADELTDITYVELPQIGASFGAGDAVAEVESVKATSEVVSVAAGTVIEINAALTERPELVNSDAFEDGWLVKLKADSLDPLGALMDREEYQRFVESSQ